MVDMISDHFATIANALKPLALRAHQKGLELICDIDPAVPAGVIGDPTRVRRVAVRFASPTRLDEDVTVDVYEIAPATFAFEATCAGAAVIKHGRVELFQGGLEHGRRYDDVVLVHPVELGGELPDRRHPVLRGDQDRR